MTNPIEKLSPRTLRLGFSLITLVVFGLCLFNAVNVLYLNAISNDQCAWRPIPERPHTLLITDIVPGGVSDAAGLKNGDILLKINGQEFSTTPADTSRPFAMALINKLQKGDYATYLIERDGETARI